jgi:hypothetical protein
VTRIIEIIVSPTGQLRLETKGFAGSDCQEASRFLEQALGAKQSEQFTAEFHTQQTDRQVLAQKSA